MYSEDYTACVKKDFPDYVPPATDNTDSSSSGSTDSSSSGSTETEVTETSGSTQIDTSKIPWPEGTDDKTK